MRCCWKQNDTVKVVRGATTLSWFRADRLSDIGLMGCQATIIVAETFRVTIDKETVFLRKNTGTYALSTITPICCQNGQAGHRQRLWRSRWVLGNFVSAPYKGDTSWKLRLIHRAGRYGTSQGNIYADGGILYGTDNTVNIHTLITCAKEVRYFPQCACMCTLYLSSKKYVSGERAYSNICGLIFAIWGGRCWLGHGQLICVVSFYITPVSVAA